MIVCEMMMNRTGRMMNSGMKMNNSNGGSGRKSVPYELI